MVYISEDEKDLAEDVVKLAGVLGKRGEDEEELRVLCGAAVEELKGLLREDVTPEDCGEVFPLAAAWMALGAAEISGDGVESFTAGEVSIRKKDGLERRAALRLQAMEVMKPWLRDTGFVFRGVRGW